MKTANDSAVQIATASSFHRLFASTEKSTDQYVVYKWFSFYVEQHLKTFAASLNTTLWMGRQLIPLKQALLFSMTQSSHYMSESSITYYAIHADLMDQI